MQNAAGALYAVNKVPGYNIQEEIVNWWLVVQKTRVIKKCFQFSSAGGERRCSPYG